MATPREVVDAYFVGINGERYASVAALFAQVGGLIAPGTPILRGDAIAGYFEAALAAYPEHYDDPVRTVIAGSTATVEIHFTGLTAGGEPFRIAYISDSHLYDRTINDRFVNSLMRAVDDVNAMSPAPNRAPAIATVRPSPMTVRRKT